MVLERRGEVLVRRVTGAAIVLERHLFDCIDGVQRPKVGSVGCLLVRLIKGREGLLAAFLG
jgi:hypothetical protein